jgi:ribose-phosphate pyrophosphokinase
MAETIKHLKVLQIKPPICIGVHAIFAEDSFKILSEAGVSQIVTCNTITHETNSIDVSNTIINCYLHDILNKEGV